MSGEEDVDYFAGWEPQTVERVAKRALILAAVGNRGLIENELASFSCPDRTCKAMLQWIDKLDIGAEAEPEEWRVLQRGPGALDRQSTINAAWRLEGCAVLLWALHLYKLPRYDRLAVPATLFRKAKLFRPRSPRRLIDAARLRPHAELSAYHKTALMTHWRTRNIRLHPEAVDFATYSKGCFCGTFDLAPFQIVDGDVALRGTPILYADPALIEMCGSIAKERHHAMNWLMGECELYPDVETHT